MTKRHGIRMLKNDKTRIRVTTSFLVLCHCVEIKRKGLLTSESDYLPQMDIENVIGRVVRLYSGVVRKQVHVLTVYFL